MHVHRLVQHLQLTARDAGQVEQVVDEVRLDANVALDGLERFAHRLGQVVSQ